MLPLIDTHQHLWDLSHLELPWTGGIPQLNKNFLMSDYLEASEGQNVSKTVYMEVDAHQHHRQREVEFINEICSDDSNPMQAAVFCADPGGPDLEAFISNNRNNPWIRGLRRVLHNPDIQRGTCLKQEFIQGVRKLGELGWSFDICLRPAELEDGIELAKACPETIMILDHCGNADPQIVQGVETSAPDKDNLFAHTAGQWKDAISRMADLPNTFCKISGIIARAKPGWGDETLAPTVDHCLDQFGEDCVFWGGDWPVCTLGAPLGEWITSLRRIIASRPESLQRKLLHDNAERIYRLN